LEVNVQAWSVSVI